MKNLIYRFSIIALIFTALVGCEEDLIVYDVDNGQSLTAFSNSSATLPVPENGATYTLRVEAITRSNQDRAIQLNVDPSSTAAPAEYTIDQSTLIIPAGEFVGMVKISGNFDEIPDLTTTTLVLNLEGIEGGTLVGSKSTFTLSIFKQCDSDLAGVYTAVSSGESTDSAPVNNPIEDFTYTVTISKVEGSELEYTISDGVAGLYIEWYGAAYGYTFETEGNFQDVCGSLSGSWVEGFGSTINLTGTVNDDGTLTISWVNGFGDSATAIYTRQ
ncbi:hypothetical protein [Gillisia hiemivivida]|uniref:Calx-beta domain-containing protein n=1 Tax=Gillisia hiemivivida TaxID=291190 RepID=A0A5C6ZT58_9FLAO|nr:hypothetical protein [Gillisia hiemivivida]TXD92986.1 hypothetical protein ES724_12115 [Gillisia hiemivivida]